MSNKDAAVSFLKLVAGRRVDEAYDRYIAADFIHHNQYFKGDRETLRAAMEEANEMNPDKSIEVKQTFEDGDTVITHSLVKQRPGDAGGAVVHIFRFRNGKVVELWDLGQEIIEDSPNENGPF